ncbi:MAG: pilus assembly protein PilM [Planctomycetota bacterium]|nr:MAG: pilus assembly protein PilM [Planctomycetota bacterium]
MISWKLKTRSVRPIGLDIGHNSIKMIQLGINGGRISVLAADKVRLDANINSDGEERKSFIVSKIKQMLSEGNFRGRNVISCLPNGQLKITSLRLPDGETGEIEQALRKEAAQRFGLDAERDAINYLVAGNVQEGEAIKHELILFATDNETIKKHIEMLEATQLRPLAIDNVPCALFRSFERSLRRQEDRERTVVFVDVGSRFTTVVFGCGGENGGDISFIKQIPVGGEKFNRETAARLGISIGEAEILRDTLRKEKSGTGGHLSNDTNGCSLDASTRQVITDSVSVVAEELAREISLCFRYYTVTFRGKRVERAVFAGGEAYESILLNVLKRQLPVEIEMSQPLRGFDMMNVNFESDRRGLLCEWAVAVGLSLKGWNGTEMQKKGPE